jgi:hypothetical protein
MVSTVFGSILIPVLICVVYSSTPTSRKRPIFISIVVSICFGLLQAIWVVRVVVCILSSSLHEPSKHVHCRYLPYIILSFLSPL